ncbi:uncharacterized protein Dana_GF27429 [Drosophila ananassae]|uniref:Uncharacterized protein n=1 Tax=Drosophila ananassae TaxID=7217 RepID=A0A0P8XTV4_DROAN|nr:uncharacterized protein LOC26514838 [Drosophila ananassae]KPU78039.1 uncharacterized protein Dana_GF27429 [Drosophila ananassae]
MDGCHNDILAPIILAVMVTNGHPLSLDEIVDSVTEVINSQFDYANRAQDAAFDGKHCHKRSPRRRRK